MVGRLHAKEPTSQADHVEIPCIRDAWSEAVRDTKQGGKQERSTVSTDELSVTSLVQFKFEPFQLPGGHTRTDRAVRIPAVECTMS